MKTFFVARSDDRLGVLAIQQLMSVGIEARVLNESEEAAPTDIAVFTAPGDAVFRRRYLSISPHKFAKRGILVPDWAHMTPFRVAIRGDGQAMRISNFTEALHQVALSYASWNPWINPVAPWNPDWKHGQIPETFTAWRAQAQQLVPPPAIEERLKKFLTPVFAPSPTVGPQTLMVIGCAAFNRPHTDVVETLLPSKMNSVLRNLEELVMAGGFTKVQVVIPEADMLDHEIARAHLHPFIFMAVPDVEHMLGKPFTETTRLWDRTHQRTAAEIAEAFTASAEAMKRQLVEPLASAVNVSVEAVSWVETIHPYLEEAARIVEGNMELLQGIYLERVNTRPSYALLHSIDPAAGLARTVGNAALYVAEAMYLRDNSNHLIANYEANDVYWLGLEPVVRTLWGDRTPYIGMVHEAYRQPWGY